MNLHLKIWRQKNATEQGHLVAYDIDGVTEHMSFLEMLDYLNEKLILKGEEPVEFDHDCREGICGQCGVMINGIAHGPLENVTTCQLHMRAFHDGETVVIEPFGGKVFKVKKDLKVDRSAFDRIIESGGFITVNTGAAPEANTTRITHDIAEDAFDSAACIGCGACVATCKNGSASLFVAAKISHLVKLPQGKEERISRVEKMVRQMEEEGFGHCTNTEACEVECPQGISVLNIAQMNYEYNRALLLGLGKK